MGIADGPGRAVSRRPHALTALAAALLWTGVILLLLTLAGVILVAAGIGVSEVLTPTAEGAALSSRLTRWITVLQVSLLVAAALTLLADLITGVLAVRLLVARASRRIVPVTTLACLALSSLLPLALVGGAAISTATDRDDLATWLGVAALLALFGLGSVLRTGQLAVAILDLVHPPAASPGPRRAAGGPGEERATGQA